MVSMSEDKIQNIKESLYEWSKNIYVTEPDRLILRNGANAINQLQQGNKQLKSQLQQRDDVINETLNTIDKMLTVGYTDENKLKGYFAVGEQSEFGCRARVLKNILNKYNGDNK